MKTVTKLACLIACLLPAHVALACSTCLSGDPTLTTMGAEKPFAGRKRITLSSLQRSEQIGVAGINQRTISEQRTTLGLTYWPQEKLAIGVRLPWSAKALEDQSLATEKTSALGDIELDMRYYLWQNAHRAKHLVGVQSSLRVPSANEIRANGEPLDSDVQAGGGLWLPSLGFWYSHFNFPWMLYASSNYSFALNKGYEEFEYGGALRISSSMQYALNYRAALQIGVNMRWSGRNRYNGVIDADSGGFLAFVAPGIAYSFAEDWLLNANVQIPILENLHGDQKEKNIYQFGLSYDF